MPYKVFERLSVRVDSPTVSILPRGRIILNAAASRTLREAGIRQVLLMWDNRGAKVAIKAALKGDKNAFAVSFSKQNDSGSISATAFVRHMNWSGKKRETYPAIWNESERMLEATLDKSSFEIPDIALDARTSKGRGHK